MPFCVNSPNFIFLNTIAMSTLTISTALKENGMDFKQ